MKIKFDSALAYQSRAIKAITDIFEGQEKCEGNFTVYSPEYVANMKQMAFNELGYRNVLHENMHEGRLVENIQKVQLINGLKPSTRDEVNVKHLDFTVEMETGTGKTYVYLRTIMDLYTKYGFSKHIIVVPSIPIKEGVYKSLQITQEHFKQLYNNVDYDFFVYDSSKPGQVRNFASSAKLQIMVINIDSFSKSFENPEDHEKKANLIHRYNDKLGYVPIDLIKNASPFVYVDEPQSTISTPIRKKAIKGLNPLAVIRYSATHREKINQVYKLDAVDAYEEKLVKQIVVGSVQVEGDNNQAYIKLVAVRNQRGSIQAQVEFDALVRGNIKRQRKWLKQNDDLEEITKRDIYEGYIINDIYLTEGNEYIDFTSRNEVIRLHEAVGAENDLQIKAEMIRKTVQEHLDRELMLNPKGIKVLSLFFIDTVANYRIYDEEGNAKNGKYAELFEQIYSQEIKKPKYHTLFDKHQELAVEASEVHNGYFSIDKRSKASNKKDKFEAYKDTSGNVKADEDTYNLIMKDKEKLLSFDSKLRFIFSHSALKEGWDNPNVFQICTLKDSHGTEIRRRQEIGRGLRLCVNQNGERVYGHEINQLTVMANESYSDFADKLQEEIEEFTGIKFGLIEDHSFANVVTEMVDGNPHYMGQENSTELFNHLVECGYINVMGKVQDHLRTHINEDKVQLPESINDNPAIKAQVLKTLKSAAGKLDIKNSDNKKTVKVNRQVLDSPEFKALWDRVKYKTTFSVDFNSEEIITACVQAIKKRLIVSRGKLHYTTADVNLTTGGVIVAESSTKDSILTQTEQHLPDIIGYLQNETNLTRRTIVKILTQSEKLNDFKKNPQAFLKACADLINEQMQLHIIDGIKYKKIGDSEFYGQELFDNEELFGYLNSNLKESKNSPYEYVVYDSKVESSLTDYFEKSDNIPVYAKLPSWFKIDTPLGTYNPDWAVHWVDDTTDQLFFVVESKGTTELDLGLKGKEGSKIECGKRHFKAIGSEMAVASKGEEVADFALSKL